MTARPAERLVVLLNADEVRWLVRVLTVALAAAEEQQLANAIPPTRSLLRRFLRVAGR